MWLVCKGRKLGRVEREEEAGGLGWRWDEESRKQENRWWVTGRVCFLVNGVWKRVGCTLRNGGGGGRRGQHLYCGLAIPRMAWTAICLTWILQQGGECKGPGNHRAPLPHRPSVSRTPGHLQIHRDSPFQVLGRTLAPFGTTLFPIS